MNSPAAIPLEDAIVDALRQLGIQAHYAKDQVENPRVGFSVIQTKTGTVLVNYQGPLNSSVSSREKIVAFVSFYLQDENIDYKVVQKPTGSYAVQFAGPAAIAWLNTLRRRVVELARFYNQEVEQEISKSDVLGIITSLAGVLTDALHSVENIAKGLQEPEQEPPQGDPVTWGSGK